MHDEQCGYFLCVFPISGVRCAIVMTQSSSSVSASVGGTVTMSCQASRTVHSSYLSWNQQKPGQPPKLLIYKAPKLQSGVPSWVSSSGSGTEFTLTISGVQPGDAATYYFISLPSYPKVKTFHLGQEITSPSVLLPSSGDPVAPSVLLFPPSKEELTTGTATIVCVANKFYPSDITVTWKVDGTTQQSGIENSKTPQSPEDNTYSLSSTLSLTSAQYNSHSVYTCEVVQGSASPIVQSFNRGDC
uniref:Ig-like domain-containing protein n=1 Tax=Oryctolagus cuniculus TaxID=9986 RepID=G1TW88_RABIT